LHKGFGRQWKRRRRLPPRLESYVQARDRLSCVEVLAPLFRFFSGAVGDIGQQIGLHVDPATTEFHARQLAASGQFLDPLLGAVQEFGALFRIDRFVGHAAPPCRSSNTTKPLSVPLSAVWCAAFLLYPVASVNRVTSTQCLGLLMAASMRGHPGAWPYRHGEIVLATLRAENPRGRAWA